jgi:arylsulfatase A-like enzyme
VVLAIRFPEGQHAGRRLAQDVRLMDLAPTLAQALGQPWPGPPEGRSLLPLLEGVPEEPRPIYIETGMSDPAYWPEGHRRYPITRVTERYALDPQGRTIHIRPELEPPVLAAKDRVAQQGRYKLVWVAMEEGPRIQLFDRAADPENRHDLAAELPEEVAALLGLMRPFLAQDGELGPAPPP